MSLRSPIMKKERTPTAVRRKKTCTQKIQIRKLKQKQLNSPTFYRYHQRNNSFDTANNNNNHNENRSKCKSLLDDPKGVTFFLQFHLVEGLESKYLSLWLDIQSFKQMVHLGARMEKANKIYMKYFLSEDDDYDPNINCNNNSSSTSSTSNSNINRTPSKPNKSNSNSDSNSTSDSNGSAPSYIDANFEDLCLCKHPYCLSSVDSFNKLEEWLLDYFTQETFSKFTEHPLYQQYLKCGQRFDNIPL